MRERSRTARPLRALAILVVLAWSLGPILLVVLSSFKQPRQIFEIPFQLTFIPTIENYTALARLNPEFFAGLKNSLIITLFAVLLTLAASFGAGYVYARARERAYRASAVFMLVVRMLPPIVVTVPLFPIVNYLTLTRARVKVEASPVRIGASRRPIKGAPPCIRHSASSTSVPRSSGRT